MKMRRPILSLLLAVACVAALDGCILIRRSIVPPVPGRLTLRPPSESPSFALDYAHSSNWIGVDPADQTRRNRLRAILGRCLKAADSTPARELSEPLRQQDIDEAASCYIARVVYDPVQSGGAGVMLSALTLGLIPAREESDVYTVTFEWFERGELKDTSKHVIHETDRYHLIFLPVIWMNLMLTAPEDLFQKVIVADLERWRQ